MRSKELSPKMTPALAQELLKKYDGNYSVLYPLLREEIATYHYPDSDLVFPNEFLFFEDDYLEYYLDIMKRKIPCGTILDIGCQNGFQSYIFEGFNYIGVDCFKHKWFEINILYLWLFWGSEFGFIR